jgi:hypothetical protein
MGKATSHSKPHAQAFRKGASKLVAEASNPKAKNDPRWLIRHAKKLSAMADAKDRAQSIARFEGTSA